MVTHHGRQACMHTHAPSRGQSGRTYISIMPNYWVDTPSSWATAGTHKEFSSFIGRNSATDCILTSVAIWNNEDTCSMHLFSFNPRKGTIYLCTLAPWLFLLYRSCPLNSVDFLMHIQVGDLLTKVTGGRLVMRGNGAQLQQFIMFSNFNLIRLIIGGGKKQQGAVSIMI